MIDLVAFVAVAAFAGFGWARGVKGMALWGVSLVAGSVAGALLARPAGTWMSAAAGMPLLVSIPLAGAVIVGVVTGSLRATARRVGRERSLRLQEGWEPPSWDRWGGSALGAVCGLGVVLFAGWVGDATGSLHGRQAELGRRWWAAPPPAWESPSSGCSRARPSATPSWPPPWHS